MRRVTRPASRAPVQAVQAHAPVEVYADDALVQRGAAQVLDAVLCSRPCAVLDEAETARRERVAVQAHDDAPERAAGAEELVDLLLAGVERQVAHIHGAGHPQAGHIGLQRARVGAVFVLRDGLQRLEEPRLRRRRGESSSGNTGAQTCTPPGLAACGRQTHHVAARKLVLKLTACAPAWRLKASVRGGH